MLDAARAGVQASFAVVGYKGRAWRLKYRGEETLLRDAQGRPLPELDVVIVGVAQSISKIYYAKAYVEGDDDAPDCWSIDGIAPNHDAPKKQNPTCADCRHNAWGSRITDAGKRAKSCQDSRRIAIVPLLDIANATLGGPMLLRIPPTSLPNLANYADLLARKGADVPWVGTQLGFDEDVAYPKITFEALGFITDEQADAVAEVMENPLIDRMLHDAAPIEAAPAAPATPTGTVTPLRRRAAASDPSPVQEPQPQPEPNPEPEPEPVQAPPAAAKPTNPFAASTVKAAQNQVGPATATRPNGAAPATRQRRTASATEVPATAPADLESAIDDLLADAH
jgi:hypothetical protein